MWGRAKTWAKLAELRPDSDARTSATMAAPGGHISLAHAGGLALAIEGELLPSFPVENYIEAVGKAKGPITLRINSGGGDLMTGFALNAALVSAGSSRVEVLVAGLCGSAATLILAAADKRRVLAGSRLWIHGPSDVVWGSASELRAAADALERLTPRMATIYGRIISDHDLVKTWLSGSDYFFTGLQAVSVGLGTVLEHPVL